ncbi:hypothetical protein CK203_032278 [Vitis vinifera]|uniref:Uncharacterized protein n=1 Tax=Vitis vinifera TaxID=29760 RepID=A0A438IJT3_VITVI|nr:hypothetical protein CK203_032278 [Vitis vinifera]
MSSCQSPGTPLPSPSCHSRDNSRFLRDYAATQINAFLWISLIAVTLLLLRKLFKLFALWAKGSRISGLPCPSFYGHSKLISETNLTGEAWFTGLCRFLGIQVAEALGCVWLLRKYRREYSNDGFLSKDVWVGCLLSESHNKYGSVVKLWLGPTQLLVSIKDPVLIKEMLLKAEDKLPLTGRAFQLAFGPSSLFSSSFDKASLNCSLCQGRRRSLQLSLVLEHSSVVLESDILKWGFTPLWSETMRLMLNYEG